MYWLDLVVSNRTYCLPSFAGILTNIDAYIHTYKFLSKYLR